MNANRSSLLKYAVFLSTILYSTSILAAAPKLAINALLVKEKTISSSLKGESIKLNPELSEKNLEAAKSQYDTTVSGLFSYTKDKSERSAAAFGTNTSQTIYQLGVSQLAPTGTQAQAGYQSTRSNTNSFFVSNPTLFDSRFVFNLRQPVLKNTLGHITRKTLEAARMAKDQSEAQMLSDLQDLTVSHLQLYWSWYLQQKLTSLNQNALSAAIRLYQTNRQKMVVGLREESDVYAFAANVDLKRSDWLTTQSQIDSFEGQLKSRLSLNGVDLILGDENTKPFAYESVVDLEREALQNNPLLKAVRLALKTKRIDVSIKRNGVLPQLDLVGSLTLNGIDPTYGTSMSDISQGNPIWQGGVELMIPLQNRAARAQHKKAKIETKQLLLGLQDLENEIINRIEKGFSQHQKAKNRINVLASAVKNQRLKWEGEIKKYDQGRSDPDIVIRYQNDYLDTQKLYASAQVEYQFVKLQLDYALGRLTQ